MSRDPEPPRCPICDERLAHGRYNPPHRRSYDEHMRDHEAEDNERRGSRDDTVASQSPLPPPTVDGE